MHDSCRRSPLPNAALKDTVLSLALLLLLRLSSGLAELGFFFLLMLDLSLKLRELITHELEVVSLHVFLHKIILHLGIGKT